MNWIWKELNTEGVYVEHAGTDRNPRRPIYWTVDQFKEEEEEEKGEKEATLETNLQRTEHWGFIIGAYRHQWTIYTH